MVNTDYLYDHTFFEKYFQKTTMIKPQSCLIKNTTTHI